MYKMSSLDDWRAADTNDRLASSADLLKGLMGDLPAPKQVIAMSKTLEQQITAQANAGGQGSLGAIATAIISEQGW